MPSRKPVEEGGKEKESFACPFPGCGQVCLFVLGVFHMGVSMVPL